jgi:hypothetical protein
MPFRSKAQMRKFKADPSLNKYYNEMLLSTVDVDSLPERVGIAKQAMAVILKILLQENK